MACLCVLLFLLVYNFDLCTVRVFLICCDAIRPVGVAASALRCYLCDYANDKKCRGEDPTLEEVAYIVDVDEDEIKLCYKITYSNITLRLFLRY